ncbi:MAG: hypothetical protein JJT96_03425 [Opitutales bacterium]|nr:hypothetical protein [Opitutales bacterium]
MDEEAMRYGFSGFGETCAGGSAARRGIARIEGKASPTTKWHVPTTYGRWRH